jgi:membrane protease YdiL (CAAX protease family)
MNSLDDQPVPNSYEHTELILAEPIAPQPSIAHRIFFGPYGLRAGWSLLIFIAMVAATGALIFAAVHVYHLHHPAAEAARKAADAAKKTADVIEDKPANSLFSHGIPLAILLFFSWVMSRIERRSFGAYGFAISRRRYVADLFKGLLSGLCAMSLLIGILAATHFLVFTGLAISGIAALNSPLLWLASFSLVGIAEEYFFRGYLQFTLARGLSGILPRGNPYRNMLGFWLATILLSLLFFAAHTDNSGESPLGLFFVFLAGMVFAYSLWRTGSLWWARGAHITWDWAQAAIYGTAGSGLIAKGRLLNSHPTGNILISGGATGPEGSLFAFLVLALLVLAIRFTLPKREGPSLFADRAPRHQPNRPRKNCSSHDLLPFRRELPITSKSLR